MCPSLWDKHGRPQGRDFWQKPKTGNWPFGPPSVRPQNPKPETGRRFCLSFTNSKKAGFYWGVWVVSQNTTSRKPGARTRVAPATHTLFICGDSTATLTPFTCLPRAPPTLDQSPPARHPPPWAAHQLPTFSWKLFPYLVLGKLTAGDVMRVGLQMNWVRSWARLCLYVVLACSPTLHVETTRMWARVW